MTNIEQGPSTAENMIAEAKKAFWVMVGFLAVIWVVQILNALGGYNLSREYGIEARDPSSLPEIFTAPLLHYGWDHIEYNSGPLFIFGFLSAYRGVKKFLAVTVLIAVVSGLGVWFISPDSITAGASGAVFGYFGYVIVRGLFDRHTIDIVIGLVMALSFAYQFTSLLPTDSHVSWQAHLFGFTGGIIGGWLFRDRRPKAPPAGPGLPGSLDSTTLLPKK